VDSRQEEYAFGRLVAALFSGFSLLALALAAAGLFSVVSYGVAQRTNEFGIRMALGATRSSVVKLVLESTAIHVLGGVVCGVFLSLYSGQVLSKWAKGSVQSPLIFAAVTLVLIIAAALAALIPARRASSVDPMAALRYE
jgi:ABC-type antimicrobial peptide transport system permease subunit